MSIENPLKFLDKLGETRDLRESGSEFSSDFEKFLEEMMKNLRLNCSNNLNKGL